MNTRWSAPSSQRTQGHREPRGGVSRLHQADSGVNPPIRAGRIYLHWQALHGTWSKMKIKQNDQDTMPTFMYIQKMTSKAPQ